ncbi:MAG: Rrf2 family transcriptional regulator [Hyphomicrobiaceae bacterium]
MELNTRGRYAVMAMADLAKFGDERAVTLAEIAQRQELSEAYLGQIFGQLRQSGLVKSIRGRSGGYRLARPADRIAVVEVMAAVEESTRMTRCGSGSSIGCIGEERCLTHGLWAALSQHIASFLGEVSLKDVVEGRSAIHAATMRKSSVNATEFAAK